MHVPLIPTAPVDYARWLAPADRDWLRDQLLQFDHLNQWAIDVLAEVYDLDRLSPF